MNRRDFIAALGSAVAIPFVARGQQAPTFARIGRLSPLSEATEGPMLEGLRTGLAELGWVEGKNLSIDLRFANGNLERLPELARDLARHNLDVIVTGSNPGALAAKHATETTPVVFVTNGDPVGGGIVKSLARPGGNLTGISSLGVELNAKRLELLKEMFGLGRIAVLVNPGGPYTKDFAARRDRIAKALNIELSMIGVAGPEGFPAAFDQTAAQGAGGLLVSADIMFITHRQRLVELSAARRLPVIYPDRAFIDAGGMLFYGAALPDLYRHAAIFVDKILRGAKPANLPIEQPTTFRFVINLRTAKALNLTIPEPFLARADEVIE